MKRYKLSGAQSFGHKPDKPELTAYKSHNAGLDFDVTYQVWPNRASLAKTIRMQQSRGSMGNLDWRPCVALTDGEGY